MAEPATFYKKRIADLRNALDQINKKEVLLSYARLTAFIASLLLFAAFYGLSVTVAVITGVVFLILFGWLVKYHNRVIADKEFHEHLIKINESEARSIEGKIQDLPDGSEYARLHRDHYYSLDLDIFGRNSVFQLVNRTSSRPASDLMAGWLTTPANEDEIKERQGAVCDMKDRFEWRQRLQVTGAMHRNSGQDPAEILRWVQAPGLFSGIKHLKLVVNLLTVIVLAAVFGLLLGLPLSALVLVLMINFLVNFIYQKRINEMHTRVSRSNNMLLSYSGTIALIEKEKFTERRLITLQDQLKAGRPASATVKELSVLVGRLDVRLNVLVSVILNLFWFWDIRVCLNMDSWKKRNAPFINGWFDVMAQMEVLSSFANLYFNNRKWVMPLVKEGNFHLDAAEAGHPLIPVSKRVYNDLQIAGPGRILLITGSNMSGKSTFLRTVGVNLILAYSGSAVCAASFKTAPVKLITSMRVSDSLEENTSTFYAELKRLSMIIKEASADQSVFLLLDEILHGTNSNDRHIGSVALLRQLMEYQASGMVATHDLALSGMDK